MVATARLELPEVPTEGGVKVGVAPLGRPAETESATEPVKPFRALTVAV